MGKARIYIGVFCLLPNAWAIAAPATPKASQAANLQQIQSEVKRIEAGIRNAREAEASLASELDRLEKLLKLQALELKLSSLELEKFEAHVQEMTLRRDSLQQSIDSRKTRLRSMLSVLPSLESRSPLAQLSQDDATYLGQYRELVSRLLRTDREEILSLKKVLDEVETLNTKLADEKERLVAHDEDLKEKQAVLELNQKLKIDLLRKTRTDQAERLKIYQTAKLAEGELETVLSRFQTPVEPEVRKELLANLGGGSAPSKRSSFLGRKGALPLPAEGKIVSAFGRKYDSKTSLYTFHKGIDIQVPAYSPVKAVFSGKIVFHGKIGGYGNLLILDHGDQFYSLVGQLGESLKKEGDEVQEGELIARSSSDQTPLYFEIRQRHIAVNPVPWFPAKTISQLRLQSE